jgi:class 3 adenylate cyclase/pimeloyl-ACP methyl ester carboxylesterase
MWVPGWVSHVEMDGQTRDHFGWTQILRKTFFVTMDKRGSGLSARNLDGYSIEDRESDIEAVANELGLETFALAGWSEGGPTAISYAAHHPERVKRLIIVGSFAKGTTVGGSEQLGEAVRSVIKAEWGFGSKLLSEMFIAEDSYARADQFVAYQKLVASPADAFLAFDAVLKVDVRSLLPDITAPTLVIHTRDDNAVPIELGQEIAAGIRGAKFVSLPGAHLPSPKEMANIFSATVDFALGGSGTPAVPTTSSSPADSTFRSILFTDLVGHTEMMSRLGDDKGREVLREHERITREVLKQHGGTEVKTMGDGFMASFGSVTKAVECAVALQKAFADREGEPLNVRVGLNAGEPIEEDGDLFGATVILASRIAAKAGAGEILVADTVRGLCSGKGFLFADRGDFVAKGFEEPVRVYEVSWRG